MSKHGFIRGGVVLALFGSLATSIPEKAEAQRSPALWMDLVQMPVAVARLDLAGVPLADLRLLVPALNVRTVEPGLFIETVRGIPILWGDDDTDRTRREGGRGTGGFVQAMHARGLRGRELADAVHRELGRRGVPAGPKHARTGAFDVFDTDYVPVRLPGGVEVVAGDRDRDGRQGRADRRRVRFRDLTDWTVVRDADGRRGPDARPDGRGRGRGGSDVRPGDPAGGEPAARGNRGRGRGGDEAGPGGRGGDRGGQGGKARGRGNDDKGRGNGGPGGER